MEYRNNQNQQPKFEQEDVTDLDSEQLQAQLRDMAQHVNTYKQNIERTNSMELEKAKNMK